MIDEIPKYPTIPDALRQAAFLKSLVPFIGAGVSKLAGYPDWDGLAHSAISFFIGEQKFSHAQLDQVSSLSPRVKLSLAAELENKHDVKIDFRKILTRGAGKSDGRQDVYGKVHRLWRFSEMFVTTNYDEELDNPGPQQLVPEEDITHDRSTVVPRTVYLLPDITDDVLGSSNSVVHIHGSIRSRESMVLTTLDYVKRYQSHRLEGQKYVENEYLTFLATLFSARNVLFIGYGLQELEILEYVLQKGLARHQSPSGEKPRHFLLQGFFSHELSLARSLESYFLSFGIHLLPYSRDERDWESLVDVLEKLCEELPPGSRLPSSERFEMEEMLT